MERLKAAIEASKQDPKDGIKRAMVWGMQYTHSKHIRGDNTLENAKYLGYLDAKELYPDFSPITFETCVKEIVQGAGVTMYKGKTFLDVVGGPNGVHIEAPAN